MIFGRRVYKYKYKNNWPPKFKYNPPQIFNPFNKEKAGFAIRLELWFLKRVHCWLFRVRRARWRKEYNIESGEHPLEFRYIDTEIIAGYVIIKKFSNFAGRPYLFIYEQNKKSKEWSLIIKAKLLRSSIRESDEREKAIIINMWDKKLEEIDIKLDAIAKKNNNSYKEIAKNKEYDKLMVEKRKYLEALDYARTQQISWLVSEELYELSERLVTKLWIWNEDEYLQWRFEKMEEDFEKKEKEAMLKELEKHLRKKEKEDLLKELKEKEKEKEDLLKELEEKEKEKEDMLKELKKKEKEKEDMLKELEKKEDMLKELEKNDK